MSVYGASLLIYWSIRTSLADFSINIFIKGEKVSSKTLFSRTKTLFLRTFLILKKILDLKKEFLKLKKY